MRKYVALLSLIFTGALTHEQPGWMAKDPVLTVLNVPIFPEQVSHDPINISFETAGIPAGLKLTEIRVKLSPGSETEKLSKASARSVSDQYTATIPGSSEISSKSVKIHFECTVNPGVNNYAVSFLAQKDACPSGFIRIESVSLKFSDGHRISALPGDNKVLRFGKILRKAGQDKVDTYRIPGIVRTGNGTLISVYDNRYNSSKDLQENIDIAMSRSIDKGRTWAPMKVIMDMGEYGGKPERMNGTGDPCILYDNNTGTIWVAALWMSGSSPDKMLWWASQPGMKPEETGQLLLVKSTDDGLTWSKPINITEQIKDPAWQLLLQGPGRGITTHDGTLVFPAQFKAEIGERAIDGGKYTCHSTIVFSRDGGNTWNIGCGAKSNTTEAQVVELSDGSLMLNMRDDLNRVDKSETNGRAVAVTRDFGKTWQVHASSNSALPEPNCMASLISADVNVSGEMKHVLFFSNPNNKTERSKMTIKASFDDGLTWPQENQLEVFEAEGFGYSCLTMVDENTLGILYEGTKDLYFQKIPVSEIIRIKLDQK